MNKEIQAICLAGILVLWLGTMAMADPTWVSMGGSYDPAKPDCEVLESDQSHTVVRFTTYGFWTEEVTENNETFNQLDLPGYFSTMEVGKPQMPAIVELIEIPADASVSVSVTGYTEEGLPGYHVYPFQPLLIEDESADAFEYDQTFYGIDQVYPADMAEVGDPSVWRDIRVIKLTVYPIGHNAANGDLILYPEITVQLDYTSRGKVNLLSETPEVTTASYDRLYRQAVINYDFHPLRIAGQSAQDKMTGYDMLIIAEDSYAENLTPLVNWKNSQGISTQVHNISTIGSSSADVKNHIVQEYNNNNIEYVLLVGNESQIPFYTGYSYSYGTIYSDYYYSLVSGNDDYADIAVGRFCVHSEAEVDNMVAKTEKFEHNTPSGDWLEKSLLVAHAEMAPGKYQECKENIRTASYDYLSPDFTTAYGADTPQGGDRASNADVINYIDAGQRVVNYRGHGGTYTWYGWNIFGESFSTSDVAALDNGDYTPVVFSIACSNNQIQASSNCLGEAFTLDADAAVAFLGANRPSYTTPNHTYDEVLYEAVFNDSINITGDVSNLAAATIINQYGTIGLINVRMYFWLGDPSLNIIHSTTFEPPEAWTATYGGPGIDEACFGTPVNDTSWSSGYHTETAYINSPKSATMTVAQQVSYSMYIPGGLCGTYESAEIKVNGNTVAEIFCGPEDETETGTFSVSEGDVVTAYVWGFIKNGDPDKKPPGSAAFTYYTTTPTDVETTGYAFAGTTRPMDGQVWHYVEAGLNGPETDTMSVAQTISYELYMPPGLCDTYELSEIRVNGTRVAVLYCGEEYDTETGTFSVQAGDIVLARVLGFIKNGDPDKLPPGSAKYSYYDYGPGDGDYYLVKTDAYATEEWSSTQGTNNNDVARGALLTSDGGYLVAGYSSAGSGDYYYVVKFDATGSVSWDNYYQHGMFDRAVSAAETDDGYLIFGTSDVNGDDDFMVIKTTPAGTELWYNTYGAGGVDETAAEIRPTGDGGFILVGSACSGTDTCDVYLAKINSSGALLWSQTLGDANDKELGYAVEEVSDGFIIAGSSDENGNDDALLIKTDNSGIESWHSIFGDYGTDYGADIAVDHDGNYILTGKLSEPDGGDEQFYIVKAGTSGDLIWSTTRGGSGQEYASCLAVTPDQGYLMSGATDSYGAGLFDFYAVKFVSPPPDNPDLLSPDNGARFTTTTSVRVTLDWSDISGADYYEVVLDDNSDFSSPLYDHDDLTISQWTTPYLGVDYYYWRARAHNGTGWGAWSDQRYFRVKRPTYTSCPVLYSFDGEKYREENPLLTACEKSDYVEVVTDYYHLESEVAARNGRVSFQLRELEDEITYLHGIELITVDHRPDVEVACAVNGSITTYEGIAAPLSAIDDKGQDRLAEIIEKDGKMFKASGPGYLIVTFPNSDGDLSGYTFGAAQKLPCPIQEEEDMFEKAVVSGDDNIGDFKVEVRDDDGNWIDLSSVIPPRANPTEEIILSDLVANVSGETITMRLSWTYGYSTDVIAQFIPADDNPVINNWKIDGHQLQTDHAAKAWDGFVENEPLILKKGDVFEFAFATEPAAEPEMERDYIIKAIGRYEPDYSVFARPLPKEFKLYNNYPNPFNPVTTIAYDLPVASDVRVEIYNVLGQGVVCLVDQNQPAGQYKVVWDGKDERGQTVASGMYFYRIDADRFSESRKMILLK